MPIKFKAGRAGAENRQRLGQIDIVGVDIFQILRQNSFQFAFAALSDELHEQIGPGDNLVSGQ